MRSKLTTLIAVPAMLFASLAVRADFLDVTVTGTVLSDSDTSNIFGFGVSPTPTGQSTAAGQPVTMTFVLNLNSVPFNYGPVPPPVGFGNPNRAYYFTNSVPAANWITWTASIGGKAVPELNLTGADQFDPNGQNHSSPADAQLWNAGGSPVYNEFDIERDQNVITRGPTTHGAFAFSDVSEAAFLRVDSVTMPFLDGLSLNQSFSWNRTEDDGLSNAVIWRQLGVGTCTGLVCYGSSTFTAYATIQLDSLTAKVVESVPEPATLGLLSLGLLGLGLRRRLKVQI